MNRRKFIQKTGVQMTPKNFGAVGDGISDDTQALNDWGDWAFGAVGDTNLQWDYFAVYKTTENICFRTSKEFYLDCNGATILRDYKGVMPIPAYTLDFSNDIATKTTTLAQTIQKGDTKITVVDASGASVGDRLDLNGGLWKDNHVGSTLYYKIIIAEIIAIDGNAITISEPAPMNFEILTLDNDPVEVTFKEIYNSSISNLKLSGLNYLNEKQAGKVNHLITNNYSNQLIDYVEFLTEAYILFKPRRSYRCTYKNLKTKHQTPSKGIYGFAPDGQVETTFLNCNIRSSSHSIAMTINASYNCYFDELTAKGENAGWSFDGHGSELVYATNSNIYGIAHAYGSFIVSNSNCYPSTGTGSLAPVCDYIYRFRHSNGFREPIISFDNCHFISTGLIELIKEGGIIRDAQLHGSVQKVAVSNSIIDNEDLIIVPYSFSTFTNNKIVISERTYNLRNHSSETLTPNFKGNYYDFSNANQGIKTPINLNGRTSFSLIIKAKVNGEFSGTNTTLAASSKGSVKFWFQIAKGHISLRTTDINQVGTTLAVNYKYDNNVRYYSFTFDGNKGVRFYIDGYFIGKKDYDGGAYENSDHYLILGDRHGVTFDGEMQEVLFYNRVLDGEEIVKVIEDPSSVDDFEMHLGQNMSVATWEDESENGNKGTIGASVDLVPNKK